MKKVINSNKKAENYKIHLTALTKYNQTKVHSITYTGKENLEELQKTYKSYNKLPRFLDDFLQLRPSIHRECITKNPALYPLISSNKFIVMPNPRYTKHETLIEDHKNVKYLDGGLTLCAWYLHPDLLTNTPFFEHHIRRYEKSNIR